MTDPECWTPPVNWAGETAHILASGPSLTPGVIEGLRGEKAITVNSTVLSAPWAPVWFFMDGTVLLNRRPPEPRRSRDGVDMLRFAREFPGLVVTTSKWLKAAHPDVVRLVKAPTMAAFPPPGSPEIRSGRSSGQTAISLAIAMGATRVVLHGFDMRAVDGREHHHREYEGVRRDVGIYDRKFLPAFAGWHKQALAAGVTVVNATPGSALTEFPAA